MTPQDRAAIAKAARRIREGNPFPLADLSHEPWEALRDLLGLGEQESLARLAHTDPERVLAVLAGLAQEPTEPTDDDFVWTEPAQEAHKCARCGTTWTMPVDDCPTCEPPEPRCWYICPANRSGSTCLQLAEGFAACDEVCERAPSEEGKP